MAHESIKNSPQNGGTPAPTGPGAKEVRPKSNTSGFGKGPRKDSPLPPGLPVVK